MPDGLARDLLPSPAVDSVKLYSATGRPWQREFFWLAGTWLLLRQAGLDGAPLSDGLVYPPLECGIAELCYGVEMRLVLSDVGMLPAQRLGRCAGRLLNRRGLLGARLSDAQ